MVGYILSDSTDIRCNCGGGMSAAPIYLGLMAIVGAYLIKNSARYIFTSEDYNNIGKEDNGNG